MTKPDLTSKVKPGRQVRIRSGAVVLSENPRRAEVTVGRPYWIKVAEVADDEIRWRGSANFLCRTPLTNVDAVEDLS